MITDYNAIKTRIANSTITDVALYSINETTLRKWYQDSVRNDEVKLLLKGKQIPNPPMCSSEPLADAQRINPDSYQPPTDPHQFEEPDQDITGQLASKRSSKSQGNIPPPHDLVQFTHLVPPQPLTQPATSQPPTQSTAGPSRTTQWRWKKQESLPTCRSRKVYSCRKCGSPISAADHTQFRGASYCPSAFPDQSKEEWLEEQRAKAAAKKIK